MVVGEVCACGNLKTKGAKQCRECFERLLKIYQMDKVLARRREEALKCKSQLQTG